MTTDLPTFTRTVAAMVAANDRVPSQREPDHRPIEPAGTVIEIEGGMRFVSNGCVWLVCAYGGDTFRGFTSEQMNRRYVWWIVAEPVSGASERMGHG
jgi:hypothetical protein